ncbi:DNA cytosine methyltransferase [Deinococcus altitudinis]|uniref:DNA cytosine methyltransferase n=1 Tax=Deinococcus altitudinis TaxID=468914 RepID=UPI0038918D76
MKGKKQAAPYAPLFPYLELTQGAVLAAGELIVDNFAGGGGASTGIEQAMGRPVDIAINHDAQALAMHAKNHPYTDHHCESVWDVDPHEVTAGRPVALAWFSPDCKHFSKAKGGKPVSKEIRGLAWVELRWAATVKPRVMITENVEEFKDWGPLGADNKPDPKQKGRTFNAWINALKRHGYEVEWRELRACDYGAPTIRKRLFIIARCDGLPIVWPEKTHGAPTDPRVKSGQLPPWRTAAECLDWDLPVPTIFGRKKPLVLGTCNRISQGILRFTLQADKPFIVTCNHSGPNFRGQSVDEPMKTITAAHDAHGLVTPTVIKTDNQKSRAACVYDVRQPVGTIVAKNGHALVSAHVTTYYGKKKERETRGFMPDQPFRTQGTENRFGLATAQIVRYNHGEKPADSVEEPARTVTTQHNHLNLMTVTAQIMQDYSGHTPPRDTVYPVTHPARTVMAQGGRQNLITGHLTVYHGTPDSKHVDIGQPLDVPLRTVRTAESFGLVEASYSPALNAEQLAGAHRVYAFLKEYLGAELDPHCDHEMQFVTLQLNGDTYVMTDISMRMLTPRELYRAQGFPETYLIDYSVKGKPLPKKYQVKMCGNSVPPPFSKAIAHANLTALPEQQAAD